MAYLGNTPASRFTSMDKQTITGDGGTDYTLDHAVGSEQEIEVFVNNVRQEPSVAYTVVGTALTMTGNVASTDDFYVVFQGLAQQTVTHPSSSALQATSGTFSGALSATTGTFSGALSATTGTFSGATSSTDLTLSGGLYVGGTGSSNYLDDFEEGTFTHSLTNTGATINSGFLSGAYVKIGDLVFVCGAIVYGSGTATGTIALSGLPFANGVNSHNFSVMSFEGSVAGTAVTRTARINTNVTTVDTSVSSGTGGSNLVYMGMYRVS